jgi:hypothetical protein
MPVPGSGSAGVEYRNRLWRPSQRLLVAVWVALLVLWNAVLARLVQTGQLTDPLVIAESVALGVAFTAAGYWGGNELIHLFAEPLFLRVTPSDLVVGYATRTGTVENPVPWTSVDLVRWRRTRAGLAALKLRSEDARWGGFLFITDGDFLAELSKHVAADRLRPLDDL